MARARTRISGFLLALAVSVVALGASAQAPDGGVSPPLLPACIGVGTEARYVPYGYNHVVVLKNGCTKAATCNVATDVNPEPRSVELATGATTEVLTFSASPSRTFTAHVTCKLH